MLQKSLERGANGPFVLDPEFLKLGQGFIVCPDRFVCWFEGESIHGGNSIAAIVRIWQGETTLKAR
jgi:hypothetical protein